MFSVRMGEIFSSPIVSLPLVLQVFGKKWKCIFFQITYFQTEKKIKDISIFFINTTTTLSIKLEFGGQSHSIVDLIPYSHFMKIKVIERYVSLLNLNNFSSNCKWGYMVFNRQHGGLQCGVDSVRDGRNCEHSVCTATSSITCVDQKIKGTLCLILATTEN